MVGPNAANAGGGQWMRGPGNPLWKGGVSATGPDRMRDAKLKTWRRGVFERDLYRCRLCWDTPKRSNSLRTHHLLEWREAPLLRYDLTNGVTLCEPCHRLGHCRGVVLADHQRTGRWDVILSGDRIMLMARTSGFSDAAWDNLMELSIRLALNGVLPARWSA